MNSKDTDNQNAEPLELEEIENLKECNVQHEENKNQDSVHQSKITELEDKANALQDKLLRAVAESENAKKRFEKMVEEARDYSIVNFAKDLLGVMDNLSRALEYGDKTDQVLTGVELTKTELESVLKKHGIDSLVPSVGDKFDYNNHHAVSQVVTDEYDSDSVIATMQVGYKIKDRLLRPALVTVSKKS